MLKVLPTHISNLIAAGEVVQRPASVVKELMENGIDAGAKAVEVNMLDSGRTLIQVIDDGCGMDERDARLAFERHATSKISEAEDLENISTFGFRGEALASIAAVAEVTLRTRRMEMEVATEVVISGSGFISQDPVSAPIGTNISIRNLFYNIPARRKFLKSDQAEFRHVISEFSRIALCYPHIRFKLSHNGKSVFDLSTVSNIKQRIAQIDGRETASKLIDIETDASFITIRGYIGAPEDAKKIASNQYLFVNSRFFRSPYLHKAIMKSYEKLILDGTTPSYYIYLEIDPVRIDVNIHPAKTEVKFEDEHIVFDILSASVRESLGKNSFLPNIDFDREGAPDIRPITKGFYTPPPKINYDPLFNPFEEEKRSAEMFFNNFENPVIDQYYSPAGKEVSHAENNRNDGAIFHEHHISDRSLIILKGGYILTPVKSGVLVIHFRRALERVLYERYLPLLTEDTPVIQQNFFPLNFELPKELHTILCDNSDKIRLLGFDIRDFGDNNVIVYGLPDGFDTNTDSIREAVEELASALGEIERDIMLESREKVAAMMARSGSRMSNSQLSHSEAQLLVDSIFACREPMRTPGGRPTMNIVSTEDLIKNL